MKSSLAHAKILVSEDDGNKAKGYRTSCDEELGSKIFEEKLRKFKKELNRNYESLIRTQIPYESLEEPITMADTKPLIASYPITLEQLNKKIPEVLKETGIEKCIQCGTCTGSCPSGRRTAFRTRVVIRKALLGLREDLLKSNDIWLCTTCYTCYERCPRKISIIEAIIALRNMAAAQGFMLPRHKEISKYLVSYGHLVPINEPNKKRRTELGLSEVPPTVHSHPEALEEVKKLLEVTGFTKLVG